MNETRKQHLQQKADSEALNLLRVLNLADGLDPSPSAIRLLASGLMAFGAEYALQAFLEYVDDMSRARGEVRH